MTNTEDLKLKMLKLQAIEMPSSVTAGEDVSVLCGIMAKESFASNKPIKSSYNGDEFVIPAKTMPDRAIGCLIDQTMNLETATAVELMKILENFTDYKNSHPNPQEKNYNVIMQIKVSEQIVKRFPEKAIELDALQLLDVSSLDNVVDSDTRHKADMLLKNKLKDYCAGKDVFEPNIYNVSKMNDLAEYMNNQNLAPRENIDKRAAQVELKMLASIDIKKLKESDAALFFASAISDKHLKNPQVQNLSEKITEIIINKLKAENSINPRE